MYCLLLFGIQFVRFQGISKLIRKLGFLRRKTVLAVIFVLAASFLNLLFFGSFQQPTVGVVRLGGPGEIEAAVSLDSTPAAVEATTSPVQLLDPITQSVVLVIPASGRNWGELHGQGGVDVAGSCNSTIHAAAAGTVSQAKEGWNHGYGNLVTIEHANNIITRYAHNRKNLVAVGQYVAAGDPIALMGRTGDATGCHVHFEVIGTDNPFVWR